MSDSSTVNNQTNNGEDSHSTEENNNSPSYSESKDFMGEEHLKEHNLTLESNENPKVDIYKSEESLKYEVDQLDLQDDDNMHFDGPSKDEQPRTYVQMEENYKEDKLDSEKKEDDDLVGLFEDSDDMENQEAKPVQVKQPVEEKEKPIVFEKVTEVINTTLNRMPRPEKEENLVICKFPPTLLVSSHPNDLRTFLKSNPKILENPPNLNNLPVLCWKPMDLQSNKYDNNSNNNNNRNYNNRDSDNKNNVNNINNKDYRSNGKLVLWDDGSLTLFVGRVPLDCEFRPEVSFLLEDSRPELKPVHAQINTRLQTRFSNLLKNELIKKNVKVKRQKMEVTSLSDAIQSQYTLQQNLMNVREYERSRRSHYSSKGLTKTFLESSDVEEDDDLL